jgi:hypothetical protein
MRSLPLLSVVAIALTLSVQAQAWEKHQSLMTSILSGFPEGGPLDKLHPAPCPADDQRIYEQLSTELQLNPKPRVPLVPTAPEACGSLHLVSGREILAGDFVDEPDHGMDQDLPGPVENFDPQDAARWMGGTQGKTSTGFRHMYFGGWQLWHPINTFQVPARAIGYAPERAALMARKARELIEKGGIEATWGFRVLAWSMHYLQDMSQPFHSVQIPDLSMVPWYALLKWPPSDGFAELVHETTRTIANYHWAFERYTLYRLTVPAGQGAGKDSRSAYIDCLESPEGPSDFHAVLKDDPRREELAQDPDLLALRTARASVQIGYEFGSAVIRFFGVGLKDRSVDIPEGKGEPDYLELSLQPNTYPQREDLTHVTCKALGDASVASRSVIRWALKIRN